jgi:flagellar protein FliS
MYISLQNRSQHGRMAGVYKLVNASASVETADPHQLIQLLFESLNATLLKAMGALQRGDMQTKADALGLATRLIDEGLKASLVHNSGDPQADALSAKLALVYNYTSMRLTLANLRNDVSLVEEVRNVMAPVATAWLQIKSAVAAQATSEHQGV